MLTVMRHAHGVEHFFIAGEVEYRGPHAEHGPTDCVILKNEGTDRSLTTGRVYVMNPEGATVGSYILPDRPNDVDAVRVA